ncbi:MAG: poly-beta-1,6-N-acetyl-D-glucosamine N-deacetylase PgaB [Candidatus Omnitrophota bacterium]|jgi:biofilm PGA synthesis lipoprotein PgaB
MRKAVLLFALALILGAASSAKAADASGKEVIIFCYHDVPQVVKLDDYALDRASFVQEIEYLRTHGYHFVSFDDILKASKGKGRLPDKAVFLTFDDELLTFYQSVYPILKLYEIPCMLSVETLWPDKKDPDIRAPLMTWDQLKEVAQSPLVEIATHTHNLHRGVMCNPQGNTSWAAVTRIYDPDTKAYETEEAYRKRVIDDLALSIKILKEKLGVDVRAVAWPYGHQNTIALDEAKALGIQAAFTIEDRFGDAREIYSMPRYIVSKNLTILQFIKILNSRFEEPIQQRVLQADLDLLYDADPVEQGKNVDAFIERVYSMRVNTVYLQAFSDDAGTGNISSVYFPSRVLPMKADLFSHVAHQLWIRDIEVYAWMPTLAIALPDAKKTGELRVMELVDGKRAPSHYSYARLSPFNAEAREKLIMLYEDLAIHSRLKGVVFQDDGYLNDHEDFNPAAAAAYKKISGGEDVPYTSLSQAQKTEWMRLKTKTLIDFTGELEKAVRKYRPITGFIRTIYSEVLTKPESEEWYAQNYADSLKAYYNVAVMAYPRMEKAGRPDKWLKKLVEDAKKYPDGINKTVFKVQAYDWDSKKWIETKTLDRWLKTLVASGARNVGYYPDDFTENEPDAGAIRLMMSTEDFSFQRKITIRDLLQGK